MGKITGVAGFGCEDIVLYLAAIFSGMGKKVAVVDKTEQEMLLEILGIVWGGESGFEERKGEYAGIHFTNQVVNREEYEHVFLVFGQRLMHPKLYECETLILITDGLPAHAIQFRQLGQWERKQCLVLRNLVSMKHSEQYLVMLSGNEEAYYSLYYSEQDCRMQYGLGSGFGCNMKLLSREMKHLLIQLVQFVDSFCKEKEIRQIIKKA